MSVCEGLPTPQSFAPGLINYVDCQAQNIGVNGYAALSAPGSSAGLLLTGFLTILIAVIGYRIMLGYGFDVREGVLTFAKIGLVLALATSWPAYQRLIYDAAVRGPGDLAAEVGGASALPGATGGLVSRLDGIDRAMQYLAVAGAGTRPALTVDPANQIAPQPTVGFNDFALGYARIGFLTTTVSSIAVTRLLAGLLLALAPMFAAFLLFEGTRGLLEGWLKTLAAAGLTSFAVTMILSVELAFLEPWLSVLLARRAAEQDILGAPAQLLAAVAVFGLVLALTSFGLFRITSALRLPAWGNIRAWSRSEAGTSVSTQARRSSVTTELSSTERSSQESRSRASVIAQSVSSLERRYSEQNRHPTLSSNATSSPSRPQERAEIGARRPPERPRRSNRRASAAAKIRDIRR